ncbi:MAG TPA: hypothetical protein VFU17_04095, partial [Candidatus Limnocylindrales bacterium]|nr:hypothetical protein [Candidatus Limnocylindrales bacterium]
RRISDQDLTLELTPNARALIVREGTDPAYGARPLKRTIQRLVENPFARALLQGQFKPGERITADGDPVSGTLVFSTDGATVVADTASRRDARSPEGVPAGGPPAESVLDLPQTRRRGGSGDLVN